MLVQEADSSLMLGVFVLKDCSRYLGAFIPLFLDSFDTVSLVE